MDLSFRRAKPSDIEAVLALEKSSFISPWREEELKPELSSDKRRFPLLAFSDGKLVGCALVWVIADELHLVSISVEPALRRQGIAKALMRKIFESPQGKAARIMTLEVRASNAAAIALYKEYGFLEVALRPRYYSDPCEDAVVMLKELQTVDSKAKDAI